MKHPYETRFGVVGDCHYTLTGDYGTRDCAGARRRLAEVIEKLNHEELDFVLSLGDIGDGQELSEAPAMLEEFRKCRHPFYFTVGNHDLVLRSAAEMAKLAGMPGPFYHFAVRGIRFIVLNAFEQSRYSPPDSPEYRAYRAFREANPWLLVQEWPGLMTEQSWSEFETILGSSRRANEQVVVFSHVPTYFEAAGEFGGGGPFARIPDYERMLALLDRYPNVKAYIAGHYHPGGTALRKGVLHKTVRSVCDFAEPTACIVETAEDRILLAGIGAESDFLHIPAVTSCFIAGTAPEGAWVMTNCGEIQQVGADGKFRLAVPVPGMYSLRAVADGKRDCAIPRLLAPCCDLVIEMESAPERRLYTGDAGGYATLQILDEDRPIRWFDLAGSEYGAIDRPGVWVEHSTNYWTKGQYAFTSLTAPEIRVEPHHPELRRRNWFKGDLHAHLVHGENTYIGNIQQSAFIARAEHYDWIYLARKFHNDGVPADPFRLQELLSGDDFLLRFNSEFPKSKSNHFGSAGLPEAITVQADTTRISSLELATRLIWERGGVTVPVHPFYGHMACRELGLWLLSAPEKVPCIDFFYDDDFPRELAETYWFHLLNRGYQIGCFATSDAAFDVGRTPGSGRGATFVRMETLTESNLLKGIRNGRTMVSWHGGALELNIGNATSGDILPADGVKRILRLQALYRKGQKALLRLIRNGTDLHRQSLHFDSDDTAHEFEFPVSESENAWYLAILESDDGRIRSAISPIYFRRHDFQSPLRIPLPSPCPPELLSYLEERTPEEIASPPFLDDLAARIQS